MVLPRWDVVPGRCGACTKFSKDFGGDGGSVYGHCGVKPRSGSIKSTDFKCDVYQPIPEVAPVAKPQPVRPPAPPARPPAIDVFDDPEALLAPVKSESPAQRRPLAPPKVLKRRLSREERDREPVSLSEEEGDEMDRGTLRELIREAIEDSLGIGEVEMLDRFVGGEVEIRPGVDGVQAKVVPIEALFRKIIMVRDNLRVLEQKLNQHPKLDDADRIGLQQYITRCYGSLTTFNLLFRHREDWFRGASGKP